MEPRGQQFQKAYLCAPLTQEANGESDCQSDIDEGRPIIADFPRETLADRFHLIFRVENRSILSQIVFRKPGFRVESIQRRL